MFRSHRLLAGLLLACSSFAFADQGAFPIVSPTGHSITVTAMNNHGQVVGNVSDSVHTDIAHNFQGNAFMWDGTFHYLPNLGGGARVTGINDNGDMIGTSQFYDAPSNTIKTHLVRFTLNSLVDMGDAFITTNLTNAGDFGVAYLSGGSNFSSYIRNLYSGTQRELASNLGSPIVRSINSIGWAYGDNPAYWFDNGGGGLSSLTIVPANPPVAYTFANLTTLGEGGQLFGTAGGGISATRFSEQFIWSPVNGYQVQPATTIIRDFNMPGDYIGSFQSTGSFWHNGVSTTLNSMMGPGPANAAQGQLLNDVGQMAFTTSSGAVYFFDPSLVTNFDPTVVISGLGTFAYNGTPRAATAVAQGYNNAILSPTPTITYAPGGSTAPVLPGIYQVLASYEGNAPLKYNPASATGTITITKLNTTTTATGGTFAYDGNPHPATYVVRNGTVAIPGAVATVTYTPGGTSVPVTPGTYSAVAAFAGDDIYNPSTSASVTVNITNSSPTFTLATTKTVGIPHDGSPATNTAMSNVVVVATDANNDPLTYAWKDATNNVVSTTGTLNVPLPVGTHTFSLTVADPHGASLTRSIAITVTVEPNVGPSLPAISPNQTVTIPHDGDPATNTVDVTVSGPATDPENDPLTYEWTNQAGTVLGSGTTLTTPLTAGTHLLKVKATDSYGAFRISAAIQVIVSAEANGTPSANAGGDQTVSVPHDGDPSTNTASVTVTGSASDPNSDSLTYEWRNSSNAVLGTSLSVTTNLPVGAHVLTFKATDPYGAFHSDTVTITVQAEPNAPPTANAGSDETITASPTTATFTLNGAGSSDPDNDTLAYSWSDGVSVIGTSQNLSVTRPVGTHTFTLTVTDPYGASHSDDVSVIVRPSNQAPVAVTGAAITTEIPHDSDPNTNTRSVTLDGSSSSDPDAGQALTYLWKDGNGATVGTSEQVTLNIEAGNYLFTLTVTDPFGESSSSSQSVIVLPEPNVGPSVDGGPDMLGAADANGQASFMITATASDPDNDSLTIRWYEGATQIGTGATLSTTLSAGTHVLTVTATDPYGVSATDTVTVGVQYTGTFFNQPINNDGSSVFKQGSTVPVKFTLTGASAGATVVARIYVAKITNNVIGTEVEPVSNVQADNGNVFRSGGGGQWIFNMSTKNLTAGTYQIRADLGDGAIHTVLISLNP
jgi:hypothetical protein